MRFFLTLLILFFSKISFSETLMPNSSLLADEVISIQLIALQNNNTPYKNAGIEQTWEFAHPSNRIFTGPLPKFISMMNTPSYSMIINHLKHNIIFINQNEFQSFYFVELIDNKGVKFGFQWIVEKVLEKGEYEKCWMTTNVSLPLTLSKLA